MSEVFIETKTAVFSDAGVLGPPPFQPRLAIILDGPHYTEPIVTISCEENENSSSYNFFIRDITWSPPPGSCSIDIGVTGQDPSITDPSTAPVIYVHAMSYV